MSVLLRLLDTDPISYECYGFWGCVRRRLTNLVPYTWRNWWTNHVRTIYAPQHSSLRAAVPKTWCDIDGCVESFLFACVIAFVEGENGLKDWEGQPPTLPWAEAPNPRYQQAATLSEVYQWAKTGRAAAEKAMFEAGSKNGYADWRAIEDEAKAKDDRYLKWIVEYRGYMWT